jgi:hypothetical protein
MNRHKRRARIQRAACSTGAKKKGSFAEGLNHRPR